MYDVMSWVAALAITATVVVALLVYLKARTLSNQIMAVSSKQFHDAAASLLQTADELPDGVLEIIAQMDRLAKSEHVSSALLKALRSDRPLNGNSTDTDVAAKASEIAAMRQELQDLLSVAVTAWLHYISHQNVVMNVRISFAVMRLKSEGMNSARAERTVGFNFLQKMQSSPC